MDVAAQQLVVRQHERRACKLSATLRVAAEHSGIVEFARSIGDGTGAAGVTVVDVSNGGAGVEAAVFLPRGANVTLSVRTDPGLPTIEIPSRVQRVTMISREPKYYIGLSYAGDQTSRPGTLGLLLERVNAAQPEKEPGK